MIPLNKRLENIEKMLEDVASQVKGVIDWKQNAILEMTIEERNKQTEKIINTLSTTLIQYINQKTGE